MNISSFDELIVAARQQPTPQRLLFVFTNVELPDDCTPQQRARFDSGNGGTLTPLMCLDKTPEEIGSFRMLLDESRQFALSWTIVFVAALSGSNGAAPTSEDAEEPLNRMVASIKAGSAGKFMPFNVEGQPVLFQSA
jgi:hypothetical protein